MTATVEEEPFFDLFPAGALFEALEFSFIHGFLITN